MSIFIDIGRMKKNELNKKFINLTNPFNLVIFSITYYLFFYFIAPIRIVDSVEFKCLFYVFASYSSFLLGVFTYKTPIINFRYNFSNSYIKTTFLITFVLSCIGVFFKIIDRFFIRGYSFFVSGELNNINGILYTSNIYSIIGSMLFLFSLIAFWYILVFDDQFNKIIKFITFFLFLYLIFEGFLLGSRFSIIFIFIFLIFYLFYLSKIIFKITFKNLFIVIILILLFLSISSNILIDRIDYKKILIINVVNGFPGGFSETVPASQVYIDFMFSFPKDSFIFSVLFGWLNLCQYIVHSYFELQLLFNHSDKYDLFILFGLDELHVFIKFISKLVNMPLDIKVVEAYYPRLGKFTTFFGPFYNDWGWFGIILMFFLGYYIKKIWIRVYQGDYRVVPLYTFIAMLILFSPVINYINGIGSYAIFTFFIFGMIFKNIKGITIDKL